MLEIRNFQKKDYRTSKNPVNGLSSDTWHDRQAKEMDRNETLNVYAC